MNSLLIEKFVAIEHAMAQERGPTKLLALLEPEESQGGWDMVLSADWVQGHTLEALDFVLAKMRTVLEPPEYYQFKIMLLRFNEPFVHAFQQFLDDNPQQREFSDIEILGLAIKRAYVIVPWIETEEDRFQKFMRNMEADHHLLKMSLAEFMRNMEADHHLLKVLLVILLKSLKKNEQLAPVLGSLIAESKGSALQGPIKSGNIELLRLTNQSSQHDSTLESVNEVETISDL